ncbi:ankyrin repeat domain-containing protein [Terrabacter aeriphilus]|uniref:Ankyrin repeat domain-containing protein n=1 Tax=Terrabacter aeriphilus TaxID=515662 RepID=A0ABP9J2Z5_9MICO
MSESPLTPEQQEQIVAVAMDMAREGRTDDLVSFLDHGLPLDLQDHAGNTLLMLAAYHGHLDTVACLVGRGADVDRRNDRDQSPVAGAMFKGEDEVVRALVAAGADLDAGSPTARETAALFGQAHLIDGEA